MPSRRTVLAGLVATPLVLAGCGRSTTSAGPAGGGPSAVGFRSTDGRGKAIELTSVPTVVVAQSSAAAALWDAGFKVKGAYGELARTDGKLNFQAGNLDLAQLTVLGQTYGQFDVEKYAALGPQLLIDLTFDHKTLWYVDSKVEAKIAGLAPTLGVDMPKRDLVQIIGSFTDLAVTLGADPSVSANAKTSFDAASAALKSTIGTSNGLEVAVMSFDATNAYIANPAQNPDLLYAQQELGASWVKPDTEDYFATISYEKLDDYDADVILVDARNTDRSYLQQPTYQKLTAVRAGRVFPWYAAAPYSYAWSVQVLNGFRQAWSSVS